MYRLTDRRLTKARPILERASAELMQDKDLNVSILEHELRECWDLGYQTLKGVFEHMLEFEEFQILAAYYMQFSNATGVVCEFQEPLRRFYGIDDSLNDIDQKTFWKLVEARSETAT